MRTLVLLPVCPLHLADVVKMWTLVVIFKEQLDQGVLFLFFPTF